MASRAFKINVTEHVFMGGVVIVCGGRPGNFENLNFDIYRIRSQSSSMKPGMPSGCVGGVEGVEEW